MMNLSNLISNIHNFLFVKNCPFCGECSNSHICAQCFSSLSFLSIGCRKCQQPLNYAANEVDICSFCEDIDYSFFNSMCCCLIYNAFLKRYLVLLKNNSSFYLADIFAQLLFNKMKNTILSSDCIISPIPLYKTRLFNRGYNQSLLLAKSFAKLSQIQCISDLFIRTRNTNSQANKTFSQRVLNVKNAFVFNEKYADLIKNKTILIIDDVITTGSTIFECAKSLKNFKKSAIHLISIGRRIKS